MFKGKDQLALSKTAILFILYLIYFCEGHVSDGAFALL